MAEKINKLIIEYDGKEYELDGGGGGSQPGPDSVGSQEIKDESVEMVDLGKSVKDSMITDKDRVTQEQMDNFNV